MKFSEEPECIWYQVMSIRLFSLLSFGVLSAATVSASDWVTLFNGKDLKGWTNQGYEVKDGVITCKGRNLITKKQYTNYIFEFEFKLPPGGNNGLGINYPGHGDPAHTGVELQILDNSAPKYKNLKPYQFHGGVYFFQAAKKGFLKPVGEWNHERVTVNGPHVKIELNGKVINEANLDELAKLHPDHKGIKRRSGYITFCGHRDPVQFRNIRIKELPDTAKKDDAVGFKPLYNGKNLEGWKQDPGHVGHWQAQGEVLHYDGKSTARDKNLWSEKSYGDFTLMCDWRWAGKAKQQKMRPVLDPRTGEAKKGPDGKPIMVKVDDLDSGIYLRGSSKSQVNIWTWPCGSGEVYGYRTQKKYPQAIRAALTPSENADKPIGEWNRFIITMKGDRLTVNLNGKTVIENAQLPGVAKSGPIALQHHGSAIEFRNIRIKE